VDDLAAELQAVVLEESRRDPSWSSEPTLRRLAADVNPGVLGLPRPRLAGAGLDHYNRHGSDMDASRLKQIFERLDAALEQPTELLIRGGAAVLAHGLEQRVTIDIDVLPSSSFVEADLRRACEAAGVGFNPPDKDFTERDYLEVVPEETLVLPLPSTDRGSNTVFRGVRLTVRTPPAADLVVGPRRLAGRELLRESDPLMSPD
jgi:hypothetical protein